MNDAGSLRALETIIASVADAPEFSGIEVLKSSVRRERGSLVASLLIDRERGVDTDLCEAVSRYIIRRADALPQPVRQFQVEVSSAGLERPLFSPAHFRRFAGSRAKVVTTLRIANRTDFEGSIESVGETDVTIGDFHTGSVRIPYATIKRANLVYEPREDLRKDRVRRRSRD